MYGMAFGYACFFILRQTDDSFEFQPCGHALCAFRLHLKECHAEHNGCRKCGADRQRKHHRLIAGVDRMLRMPQWSVSSSAESLCFRYWNWKSCCYCCSSTVWLSESEWMSYSFRSCPVLRIVHCGTQRTSVIGCTCCHFTCTQVGFLLCSCKQFMLAFVRRLSFCCFRLLL